MTNNQKISVGICVIALGVLLWPVNHVWRSEPETNILYDQKQFYIAISQYRLVFRGNFAMAVIGELFLAPWGRTQHYDLTLYHYHDGQLEKTVAKDVKRGSSWMYQGQFYYGVNFDPDVCSETLMLQGTKMTRLDCARAKEADRALQNHVLYEKGRGNEIDDFVFMDYVGPHEFSFALQDHRFVLLVDRHPAPEKHGIDNVRYDLKELDGQKRTWFLYDVSLRRHGSEN